MNKNNHITSKTCSGIICGKPHDIVITEFFDKYFIIISDNGKIGTLVEILFEVNQLKQSTSLSSKTLFGIDKPEVHAVAQSIVETLDLKKPVIFGFSIKLFNASTTANIRQIIHKTLKENEKENASDIDCLS